MNQKFLKYLVDLSSSDMLSLKIKPCMFMYKYLFAKTANGLLQ